MKKNMKEREDTRKSRQPCPNNLYYFVSLSVPVLLNHCLSMSFMKPSERERETLFVAKALGEKRDE